jgi:hypothetical protein
MRGVPKTVHDSDLALTRAMDRRSALSLIGAAVGGALPLVGCTPTPRPHAPDMGTPDSGNVVAPDVGTTRAWCVRGRGPSDTDTGTLADGPGFGLTNITDSDTTNGDKYMHGMCGVSPCSWTDSDMVDRAGMGKGPCHI